MNSDKGIRRGRWADRPDHLPSSHIANEDDLAVEALLGEASKQSAEQEPERKPDRRPHLQPQNQRYGDTQNSQYCRTRDKRIVEDDTTAERDLKRGKTRRWGETVEESRRDETPSLCAARTSDDDAAAAATIENPNKVKANFGLSGALAGDTQTGNVYNGVTLKFTEPSEARIRE